MTKTKTMVLVIGFNFASSAGFQGKCGSNFGKSGFSFGFLFGLREGVGVFLLALNFAFCRGRLMSFFIRCIV